MDEKMMKVRKMISWRGLLYLYLYFWMGVVIVLWCLAILVWRMARAFYEWVDEGIDRRRKK